MMPTLSHATVIRNLGGLKQLAGTLGVKPTRLSKWPVRGIPPLFWHRIEDLAAAAGMDVTAESLERTKPPGLRGRAA